MFLARRSIKRKNESTRSQLYLKNNLIEFENFKRRKFITYENEAFRQLDKAFPSKAFRNHSKRISIYKHLIHI